jgi:aromatic ring-opening dioxygenase LigB subunit
MSIVAAAVLPHSPVLLSSIAKEHSSLFSVTQESMRDILSEGIAAQPDVILVLTPHGPSEAGDIALHTAEHFRGVFDDFGDMTTTLTARGAVGISHQLHSAAEAAHVHLPQQTFTTLDYGTSIPLTQLPSSVTAPLLCVVQCLTQDPESILRCADVLREFTIRHRQRFFVIASADCTRRRDRHPDARRRPTAEERTYSSAITAVDAPQLSGFRPDPTTCGYGPILMLLAMLQGHAAEGHVRTFEAPLGVGLLTADFSLRS